MELKKQEDCLNRYRLHHKIWLKYHPDDSILIGECIHHINGNHKDNRIINLKKMISSKHLSFHNTGSNHYFYGKKHTEETKKKISKTNSGKNHPFYGKHHSEESKRKMSLMKLVENNGMYDKTHSEETKRKMRKAWKNRKRKIKLLKEIKSG